MNQLRTSKIVSTGLIVLVALLILAQVSFREIRSGGGWCSPYLDAPLELGHPARQFVSYGFPIPFVTVIKDNCFSAQSTTYEWFFPGIVIDGFLLLGMIWLISSQRVHKKS